MLQAARVPPNQQQALEHDAETVAALLRSHPLALIQAGTYVSHGHCTLKDYPRIYEQQRKRLLAFRPSQAQSRYRDVYATFEASAQIPQSSHLESVGDALALLPILASCGPNNLPLLLLSEAAWKRAQKSSTYEVDESNLESLTPWHISHLPPFLQIGSDLWDSFRVVEAVRLLKAFSLISTDTHNGFLGVSMHPLTHAWARDRLNPTEQHEYWVTTGCLVVTSCKDRTLWDNHHRQIQPHLQALTSWEMTNMFSSKPQLMICRILVGCGSLLNFIQDDVKVFDLMDRLFNHLDLHRLEVDSRDG